jgi:WhiB family redox-sensing transcriptional regulator
MADPNDSWRRRAACSDKPTALFFPDLKRPDAGVMVAEAKSVCAGCPVREDCLTAGWDECHGIWGGLTVAERRAARRSRQGEAA